MKGFINGSCCFSILKSVVLVSYEGELFLVPKCNNSLGVVESFVEEVPASLGVHYLDDRN